MWKIERRWFSEGDWEYHCLISTEVVTFRELLSLFRTTNMYEYRIIAHVLIGDYRSDL